MPGRKEKVDDGGERKREHPAQVVLELERKTRKVRSGPWNRSDG